MGSSINNTLNTTVQTSVNNVFQEAFNVCKTECTNTFSGVNIIIGPGSKVGDIVIDQKCRSDSLCTMKNQLDAIATQQLEAIQQAESKDPGKLGIIKGVSINTAVNFTTQVLSNTITQVIGNVCQASANNLITNVNVYTGPGSEVGTIEFTQEGSATASCAIENLAAISVIQSSQSNQIATSKTGSALVLIFGVVAIAVIILGLSWITAQTRKNEANSQKEVILGLASSGAIAPGSLTGSDISQILGYNIPEVTEPNISQTSTGKSLGSLTVSDISQIATNKIQSK